MDNKFYSLNKVIKINDNYGYIKEKLINETKALAVVMFIKDCKCQEHIRE